MFNNLPTLVNRLFTAVLLVMMLFACQQMPESQQNDQTPGAHQEN
ncbi:MAG: hypothetical protein AAFQ80_15405 [Cyanobacteria bacterium J06621_8]